MALRVCVGWPTMDAFSDGGGIIIGFYVAGQIISNQTREAKGKWINQITIELDKAFATARAFRLQWDTQYVVLDSTDIDETCAIIQDLLKRSNASDLVSFCVVKSTTGSPSFDRRLAEEMQDELQNMEMEVLRGRAKSESPRVGFRYVNGEAEE